ncbi:hypothetical protein [Nibricoccus aquaticus]|uniref:hypothetical protein n=1 Tax=Nibricoccus aquaticus TaxID=2576891 RepID=UPI0010FD1123|nr:hypothetical protein [Nibricoccus aquaticus]
MCVVIAVLLGGCVDGPVVNASGPGNRLGKAVDAKGTPVRAPFYYEPLPVRNACFVESVRLYDQYLGRNIGGESGWVKVLQWGSRESDDKIGLGHAVAVFTARGTLWTYDINHGFTQLAVAVDRRADLTDVTPEIFAKYPQQRPVLAMYREDGFQQERTKVPENLFYHASQDVREVTKVASELGRVRPVKVVEFKFNAGGELKTGMAAAFLFGNRPCLYMPAKGTQIGRVRVTTIDDLPLIVNMLKQLYPNATDVKWGGGGYWFMPPKG